MYGIKHTLTLTRNDDDDAIFRANAADEGRVTLNNVSCFMPFVTPGLKKDSELYKNYRKRKKVTSQI